jgi:hypothetical protein
MFGVDISREKTAARFLKASAFHIEIWLGSTSYFFANTSMVSFSFKASKNNFGFEIFPEGSSCS